MEKYVIPPIFDLDFKFPASFLLLQQLRQVRNASASRPSRGYEVRTAKIRLGRAGCRSYQRAVYTNGRPARRAATCRERDVSLLTG